MQYKHKPDALCYYILVYFSQSNEYILLHNYLFMFYHVTLPVTFDPSNPAFQASKPWDIDASTWSVG